MKRTRSENASRISKRQLNDDDSENSYKATHVKETTVVKSINKPTSPLRSLTSSVQSLTTDTSKKPQQQQQPQPDIFQRGKALFRRTVVPSRLIGREAERTTMMDFWTQHVLLNKPGGLYISGAPGTGKTAMLNDVKRQMETTSTANKTKDKKHTTKMAMINCMSVNEPKAIYTKIVTELKPTNSRQSPFPGDADIIVQAEHLLLNSNKNTLYVVVLDEIDHLVTRDKGVLYKLFEWTSLPSSRLVLIGIANAMNMTDLVLPRLRAKNCEPQLLNFNPYKAADISAIIKDRLYSLLDDDRHCQNTETKPTTPLPLIQPIAVELCAKKVAARKGDLRQAFDLCQQAIELAHKEYKRSNTNCNNVLRDSKTNTKVSGSRSQLSATDPPKVTIRHISAVSQSLTGNSGKDKLSKLTTQQQIVMGTLWKLKQKKTRTTMSDVCSEYTSTIKANGTIPPVTTTELYTIISNIQDIGLLSIKGSKEQTKQQVLLNMEDSDLKNMIDEVPLLKNIFQ
ncbi:P-loop containing nucleoside triphosphate hydrolase protein [Absidia repens]|uniref:Cell division control protein n=1 Tax=Absidia repens TaxID=90262 RepID=A0A1X2IFV6_9FUNG|nr:P-loop containing nucleoside triphosphate hydrolase protein [Absidia repens]